MRVKPAMTVTVGPAMTETVWIATTATIGNGLDRYAFAARRDVLHFASRSGPKGRFCRRQNCKSIAPYGRAASVLSSF